MTFQLQRGVSDAPNALQGTRALDDGVILRDGGLTLRGVEVLFSQSGKDFCALGLTVDR
jgi:hypothetical protein